MLPNFSVPELLIIMVVVLLLFGAKRIPEIAGSMGKGIKEFKKQITDAQQQISDSTSSQQPPRLTSEELRPPRSASEENAVEPKRLIP